jgi:hypothetical protein
LILRRPKRSIDTGFRKDIECAAKLCWADCITNTGWKKSRHERVRSSCGQQAIEAQVKHQNLAVAANIDDAEQPLKQRGHR